MDNITIRKAKNEDIPAIGKLLYQIHKVHSDLRPDIFKSGVRKYTDEELAVILTDEKRPIFTAVRDGEVVGYSFCIFKELKNDGSMVDQKILYIDDLCVDENARGCGIGTLLYEYVVEYARECACNAVTLNVWADNTSALRFYEKIGLKVRCLTMEKIL